MKPPALPLHHLVISALGPSHINIVEELARTAFQCSCHITDSRMSILGQEFAMIVLISGNWSSIAKLEAALPAFQDRLNIQLLVKRTQPRAVDIPLIPYSVQVISVDRAGILLEIAEFFATSGIMLEDLHTEHYLAQRTLTPMFALNMLVNIPEKTHLSSLRERFMLYCEDRNLDAFMEPLKG